MESSIKKTETSCISTVDDKNNRSEVSVLADSISIEYQTSKNHQNPKLLGEKKWFQFYLAIV